MTDDEGLSVARLKATMRKFDHLLSDDVIGVSYLFPPDKCLIFSDHRGKVFAMGERFYQELLRAISKRETSPLAPWPAGLPFINCDAGDELARDTKARIAKSMHAAVDVAGALKALGFNNRGDDIQNGRPENGG